MDGTVVTTALANHVTVANINIAITLRSMVSVVKVDVCAPSGAQPAQRAQPELSL